MNIDDVHMEEETMIVEASNLSTSINIPLNEIDSMTMDMNKCIPPYSPLDTNPLGIFSNQPLTESDKFIFEN